MRKRIILILLTAIISLSSFAGGDQPTKRIPSKNVKADDIIVKSDESEETYQNVTNGYKKIKVLSIGGTDVEIFKKKNFFIVFNKQKDKYGWITFRGNEDKLNLVIQELVLNIYNS